MPEALNGRLNGYHVPRDQTTRQSLQQTAKQISQQTDYRAVAVSDAADQDGWSHATKELLDSMPKVWTRGLFYLLLLFAGVVIPWAMFSRVDETGTARGRLEPDGQTLRLDAEVPGSISAIQVKEGDRVEAGQPLLTLDSELVKVELQQAQDQLEGQHNRLSQLNLLRNQLATTFATQQQQNQAQALEKETKIDQAARQIDYAQTERDLTALNVTSAARELERYQALYEQGIIPEVEVVQYRDALLERERIYQQADSGMIQAKLQMQEQEQGYDSLVQTGKLSLLRVEEELKNLETQITQLNADIVLSSRQIQSLQLQLKQRAITSPVAGVVFELPFQQAGSVVQPGVKVAEIAPKDSKLIVKAEISTAESGSLRPGLPVKVKFDAYPFQDYGIAMGKLTAISPTSRVEETIQGSINIYQIDVELTQPCLPAPQGCIEVRPGDTATAEVIVRQRRIIDIILNPFKKLNKDGLQL